MPEEPLAPNLETSIFRDDGAVTVRADGEVDLVTAPRLSDALGAAQTECGHVVVDLRAVRFMDSTGIRALLEARERAEMAGARLRLTLEPEGPVERLLDLAGVLGLFETG